MQTIFLLIIGIGQLYFLFKIWGELKIISSDPRARTDLEETLAKLSAIYTPKKGKIVAFKTKNDEDD